MHSKNMTGEDDEGRAGARTIIFQRSATCSGRFTYSLAKKSSAPPAALMGYDRANALAFERKRLCDGQAQTEVAVNEGRGAAG
jgi:hypothetical protein